MAAPGQIELKPAKDANLLNYCPFSEARWLWMPVTIPLTADAAWQRKDTGQINLDSIDAISLSLDSWGGDPFTIWLDGLAVEKVRLRCYLVSDSRKRRESRQVFPGIFSFTRVVIFR